MLRLPNIGLRCLVRNHVRFYRKKRLLTSHIPALKNNELLREQKMINLEANSPEEVEEKLRKLGFEELDSEHSIQDMMLSYLKYANSGFKRSSKNWKRLQKELTVVNTDDNTKLGILFDYLIKESQLEIKRIEAMDLTQIKDRQMNSIHDAPNAVDEPIESETDLEKAVISGLFNSPSLDGETYMLNTDFVYQILTDLNNKKKPLGSKILSVEQLVEVFELAKTVPIDGRRKRGIFLAGNLIYALGTVRMDPVNESFYIESLVNYGLYRKAYHLFETNRDKVDERWWYEMGMMIALRANYLRKFDKLLSIADEKFGGYPYISPKVLKLAIKKKLYLRDFAGANALSDRFLKIVTTFGLKSISEIEQKRIDFDSEEQADSYLNEVELPTTHDILTIIDYHLFRKNWNTVYRLMAAYLERIANNEKDYQFFVVHMKLNLLRDLEYLKESLQPHMAPAVAKHHLNLLQEAFDRTIQEVNVDPSTCQELLFDNVASLVANPFVTKTIERFVVSSLRETDIQSSSKSFRGLLKLLLATGREKDALKLLSKMEDSFKQAKSSTGELQQQFYAVVNAHHYAEFIEYFTLLALKSKKNRKNYKEKVSRVLKRMTSIGVNYNAVLLTKLLIFHREVGDLQDSFSIINNILERKENDVTLADTDRTNFYNRRDLTRPLYLEIWKSYSKYYYVYSQELQKVDRKSNYPVWMSNVSRIVERTNVHPQFSIRTLFDRMVNVDNILPDEGMYFVILVTFMKRRDWQSIPAVLAAMVDIHGLPISENLVNYLMKGIEREYVMVKNQEPSSGLGTQFTALNSKQFIQQLKITGTIRKPDANRADTADGLIENILTLLRYKNPGDLEFQHVREAMEELKVRKSNVQELISIVLEKNIM